MSVGSILVSVALLLFLGAYVARPFRRAEVDLDRLIEARVARARTERSHSTRACPHCGRPIRPDDHFCAKCGASLEEAPQ